MEIDEYDSLKREQLERIKQRDNFLNLNIVAVGLIAAVAIPDQARVAWLVVPWVTLILGWAYLVNDDKVSAIARHLEAQAGDSTLRLSRWEASEKGFLPVGWRRFGEMTVFVVSFVLPVPIVLIFYRVTSEAAPGAGFWALGSVEVVMAVLLCVAFVASITRRRRQAED